MKKLTERQQIQQWLSESYFLDDSEKTVTDIFEITMKHKESHPDWSLEQLYDYAYITYVNKLLAKMLDTKI